MPLPAEAGRPVPSGQEYPNVTPSHVADHHIAYPANTIPATSATTSAVAPQSTGVDPDFACQQYLPGGRVVSSSPAMATTPAPSGADLNPSLVRFGRRRLPSSHPPRTFFA